VPPTPFPTIATRNLMFTLMQLVRPQAFLSDAVLAPPAAPK
jgi:hypothetical protein